MNAGQTLVSKMVTLIINPIIMLLFASATFLFMWGLVVFMAQSDNTEARKKGLNHMVWGFVGMLIIVTVYGIMSLIAGTIGVPLPRL